MLPTTDQYRNCIPEAVSIARSVHRRQKLQQARMQTHSTIAGSRSVRKQIELPSILQICCQHVNVLRHDTHIVSQHVIVSHILQHVTQTFGGGDCWETNSCRDFSLDRLSLGLWGRTVRRHKDGELMCIQPIKHRIKVKGMNCIVMREQYPDTGMGRDCPPCSGHDSEHKRFRLPGRHVFCQRSGLW